MPTKKADTAKSEAVTEAKAPRTDVQGHLVDGPDFIPDAKTYDPAKHTNHSHPNP